MTGLTKASILLDLGAIVCLTLWLFWARRAVATASTPRDPRDGTWSRLLDTPAGPHRWSITYDMAEHNVGRWVEKHPTGKGWGRCDCGLRVEGEHGQALALDQVHATMAHHIDAASATLADVEGPSPVETRPDAAGCITL
jgi:hypothetical protein